VAGKVSGPGSGPPVGGPGDDKIEGPSGAGGKRFADKLGATDAARPSSEAAPAQAARGLTADVAAELAAGRIDQKAALDRVIERVIDKQLGPGAPAAVREKVRAALQNAVAEDPVLTDKIRSLTR
jgi:hypothetical protein